MSEHNVTVTGPRRRNADVFSELLPLAGSRLLDVGCGDGGLVRLAARHGARALGVDPNGRALDKARAATPVADESYLNASGAALPLADQSFDIAVFFNSLHHIPATLMGAALAEAWRVLRPAGWLYVCEPLAQGAHFLLTQPVEDETEVRAQAYDALMAASGFQALREEVYDAEVRYVAFEAFRQRMILVDDRRQALFDAQDQELRHRFAQLCESDHQGDACFCQPMRVNLLRREEVRK